MLRRTKMGKPKIEAYKIDLSQIDGEDGVREVREMIAKDAPPEVASILAKVASRYAHVIVCADEPQVALSAIELLPAAVKTLAVQSPVVDGVKLDANALLQAGQLDSVLFDLLRKVRA